MVGQLSICIYIKKGISGYMTEPTFTYTTHQNFTKLTTISVLYKPPIEYNFLIITVST